MEFICAKDDLANSVSIVERIVSTRSTLPIIGNILIETNKNNLKIAANNLEIGMEISVPAKIEKEGSILIPAKTFGGLVTKLPDTEIDFKVSEKGLVRIAYGQSSFSIHGLPSDEFPALPKIKEVKSFSIKSGVLAQMLKQTIFAVSNSEDKYVLNGLLVEMGKSKISGDNSNIRIVSTDGYRLAKRGEEISNIAGKEMSIIVPAKAMGEILRILDAEKEDDVKINVSEEQISIKYKHVHLISRLIQGQFPDYKQVIPKASETKIILERGALLEACERAAVIASAAANIVRMEVKNGKLHIIASAPEVGNADEVVAAEIKGKEKTQIAFNVRLITEALKAIEVNKVEIDLSGPLSPGILKPEKGSEFLYIVMPIRTQETAA